MEDIKILEDLIKYWEDLLKAHKLTSPFFTWIKDDKIEERQKALQNLITRNRELEKQLNLEKEKNKKFYNLFENDLGNIINLGILISEHAEKPKNKNIYVDEAHAFLDTLDYYYISKLKIKEVLEQYKFTEIGDAEKLIKFYKKLQELLENKFYSDNDKHIPHID